ncbi:MAG: cadherin-like domain-containing protein, partial [Hyphomicrobiales bacterium]
DAPDTVIDTYTTTQNVPLTGLEVLANDSDPEGDALSIGDIISTTHGTTTVSENGTLNYTPDEGYTGEDVITYIVADEHGATSEAHAYINVESINVDPPSPEDGISIAVFDVNPRDFLPRTGNFTATEQVSGALNDGVITITDTQDLTFSDDNNGAESARSSGEVNGQSWTNINTDNEYQWVLRHPENGEEITVFQVHVEGSVGDYFWGATGELQAGVTYQVISYNSNPSASQGVPYDEMVLAGASQHSAEQALSGEHDEFAGLLSGSEDMIDLGHVGGGHTPHDFPTVKEESELSLEGMLFDIIEFFSQIGSHYAEENSEPFSGAYTPDAADPLADLSNSVSVGPSYTGMNWLRPEEQPAPDIT